MSLILWVEHCLINSSGILFNQRVLQVHVYCFAGLYLRLGWNTGSFGGTPSLYLHPAAHVSVHGSNLVLMSRTYRNKEHDLKTKLPVKICHPWSLSDQGLMAWHSNAKRPVLWAVYRSEGWLLQGNACCLVCYKSLHGHLLLVIVGRFKIRILHVSERQALIWKKLMEKWCKS